MAGMSLSQYLATFTGATAGFEAGLKRAQWDAVGIRAEGPEVELRRLQDLYNILRDAHARSPFATAEARDRLVVLATAEVFRACGRRADSDNLISEIGACAVALLDDEVFFEFPAIDWRIPLSLDDSTALRA